MATVDRIHAPRQMLAFRVGDVVYGIDTEHVVEILGDVPVAPLPQAPNGILGLVDVRARRVPVFDLHWKFGVATPAAGAGRCLLAVEVPAGVVAVLASDVDGIVEVEPGALQRVEVPGDPQSLDYLRGVLDRGERLVLWVDPARLIPEGAIHAAGERVA